MRDLQSRRAMWIKATLFVGIGLLASGLILVQVPDWHILLLLALAIWAFCRAYYFAFYVIQTYVDPSFCYAGLFAMFRYLWNKSGRK
jgi:hypothetical protein